MSQSTPSPLGEKQMAVLMAMLVALMPFSVDAYLPAIPEMAQSLSADIHRIEQSLVLFMFGVAFGQVVGGAVSDIKGRRPVALVGLSIYFAAVVALTMVQSADGLLNLRAVQAFFVAHVADKKAHAFVALVLFCHVPLLHFVAG